MIIDRFENEFAVIELNADTFFNIPKSALPNNAKEGDCISIILNEERSHEKLETLQDKMDKLFKD